jgi:hypothetical protein
MRISVKMSLPVEKRALLVPPLEELAKVLEEGLKGNFSEVSVSVVECPDLSLPTWNLAAQGLCGSPQLLDVGGVPYLMPVPDKTKTYDLGELAALAGLPGGLIIGAGAGSSKAAGVNCEMMPNARAPHSSSPGTNLTHIARVSTEDGSCILERYPSLEAGPLANVLISEGKPGRVLEIQARRRTGSDNFVSAMRKTVAGRYGAEPVGMGGVFQIKSGRAKLHVMPDFSVTPLISDEDVNKWLRFYDTSSPLVCLSEFVSHDPGLDLRVEHTHCFSNHGDGGHYHCDTTPDVVHYHGYFTVAEQLIRVDRPQQTHNFGRD